MDIPPPPPPPPATQASANSQAPKPPVMAATGFAGAFMVELLVYNGFPFKDHWAYFVRSHEDPDVGVLINAAGDVRNGFRFEVERSHDFRIAGDSPMKRTPLQWIGREYFDKKEMLNHGKWKTDHTPACVFEASAYKVKAPEKTLRAIDDKVASVGKKITQRNCQTWIVESADQLVRDCIFSREVAGYLHAVEQ